MTRLSFDRIPRIPPQVERWFDENAPELGVWQQDLMVFLYEWMRRVETEVSQQYDLAAHVEGIPTSGTDFMQFPAVRAYRLPTSLVGSQLKCDVAPTATLTLSLYKNAVSIGTMSIAAGATTGTFNFTAAVTFLVGDLLTVRLTSATDATADDVSFMLKGEPA